MLVAEVAPVVVEIPWALIGVGVLALWLVAFGLKKTWDYTLGAILKALADHLNIDAWKIHIHLGSVFTALNDTVEAKLASALLATETIVGKWWHVQAQIAKLTYDSLAYLAHSTVSAFDSLVHGTIPKVAEGVVAPVRGDLRSLRRALTAQARALEVQLAHRATALEAQIERDFGIAHRGIDYVRGTAIPRVLRDVRALEGEVASLRGFEHRVLGRRLTRLERLLGFGVLSGIAVAALTRVFPYWQCRNVKRGMRGLCRMDRALLDLLLGAGLEAAVLVNICQSVRLFTDIARTFEPELRGLVAVAGAALQCASGDAAGPLGGQLAELPPPTSSLPALPV